MPYVRVTRDQRGYENTYLLHAVHPGERPRVLYWYRSAPGIRLGRNPFDEDAIRVIETRYPDIDFDWSQLMDEATSIPPDVERRPERPRRRPPTTRDEPGDRQASPPAPARRLDAPPAREASADRPAPASVPAPPDTSAAPEMPAAPAPPRAAPTLLDQLVGREIAGRLRARHAELAASVAEMAGHPSYEEWRTRAEALDPDRWTTPDAVLRGVESADRGFDDLRRALGIPD